MARPAIVTHCGAGSSMEIVDCAERAGRAGLAILEGGGRAIDAVTQAVVILEDDPRTNAGTGARMRLDGKVQLDASIMTGDLECGAVACLENVRNPILVARKVMDTPHVLLAGPDAIRFARRMGFRHHSPVTEESRRRLRETLRQVKAGEFPAYARERWLRYERLVGTVGAVARDSRDRFCAGNSTGGVAFMLAGRVGDSPIIGAGLYAGPRGAVTVTGAGEEIIRHVLSKSVYDRIAEHGNPQRACEEGLRLFPSRVPIGILAVGARGAGVSCNRDMAWWTNSRSLGRRPHRMV